MKRMYTNDDELVLVGYGAELRPIYKSIKRNPHNDIWTPVFVDEHGVEHSANLVPDRRYGLCFENTGFNTIGMFVLNSDSLLEMFIHDELREEL